MSTETNPQVAKLIEEGIAAAKAGDKALARGKLETAVKLDQYHEQAWFWLASVVETDEERRTCLGNVIIINPQNERAQQMLDKIEGRVKKRGGGGGDNEEEGGGFLGLTRKQSLMAGGIVVAVIVVLGILVLVLGGGGDPPLPTHAADAFTSTPDAAGTATALATITPTITISPTPTAAIAVAATWTPTLGPTEPPTPEPLPPLPPEVPGRIIIQSGGTAAGADNLPIVVLQPSNLSARIQVSGEGQRGQNPVLAPGRNRFAWAQYGSGTRSLALQIQNFGAAEAVNITSLYDNAAFFLNAPNEPAWAGNRVAFTAQLFGAAARDLWLLEVEGVEAPTPVPAFGATLAPTAALLPTATSEIQGQPPVSSALTRLTNSEANASYPMFDPSGTALVYVAEVGGQTDLQVINVNSLQTFVVTTNGNTLIESAPDWGIYNGINEIVFSASQGDPNRSDIWIMEAEDASGEPQLLFDFGDHDIKPRFSPDGRYIVFSSDRDGNWDVFIYDRQTGLFHALEANPNTLDIANDWTE